MTRHDRIIAALTGETSNAICIALTLLAWIIRLVG